MTFQQTISPTTNRHGVTTVQLPNWTETETSFGRVSYQSRSLSVRFPWATRAFRVPRGRTCQFEVFKTPTFKTGIRQTNKVCVLRVPSERIVTPVTRHLFRVRPDTSVQIRRQSRSVAPVKCVRPVQSQAVRCVRAVSIVRRRSKGRHLRFRVRPASFVPSVVSVMSITHVTPVNTVRPARTITTCAPPGFTVRIRHNNWRVQPGRIVHRGRALRSRVLSDRIVRLESVLRSHVRPGSTVRLARRRHRRVRPAFIVRTVQRNSGVQPGRTQMQQAKQLHQTVHNVHPGSLVRTQGRPARSRCQTQHQRHVRSGIIVQPVRQRTLRVPTGSLVRRLNNRFRVHRGSCVLSGRRRIRRHQQRSKSRRRGRSRVTSCVLAEPDFRKTGTVPSVSAFQEQTSCVSTFRVKPYRVGVNSRSASAGFPEKF